MTNWEYIQTHDCEQVAHYFCDMVEDELYKNHDESEWMCDHCIMQARCSETGNGWLRWLMEEKT